MLTDDLCAILYKEADRLAPEEMCGVLLPGEVFVGLRNVAINPCHSFEIDPEEFRAVAVIRGAIPCAIVHSHPGAPSNASAIDCQLMDTLQKHGRDFYMVIVGLNPRTIRVYRKQGDAYTCLWNKADVLS
jgi:proteasome lid subunit RPN8/RPN11